jgi:hypothetical protein
VLLRFCPKLAVETIRVIADPGARRDERMIPLNDADLR